MRSHMLRAVLWDLDGTLVDSAESHFESWRDALRAEGRTITRRPSLTALTVEMWQRLVQGTVLRPSPTNNVRTS